MRRIPRSGRVALAASLATLVFAIASGACGDDPMVVSTLEADSGNAPDASGADAPVDAPVSDASADARDAQDAVADGADAGRTCTDSGWCHTSLPSATLVLRDVWSDGSGVAWTVSESGEVLRFDGTAWSVAFQAPGALYAVWGASPTDLWVGGANGLFHGSGATSTSLTFQAVDLSVPISSILGISASDIWAVGYDDPMFSYAGGRVFHYAGGSGASSAEWTEDEVTTSLPANYFKVWGTNGDDVWIGGEGEGGNARVAHRISDGAGGTTWTTDGVTPPNSFNYFRSGFSISRNEVWFTGFGAPGSYFVGDSTDNGLTFAWTEGSGAVPKSGLAQVAGWGTAPNDVWLAGILGRLHHWDGTNWHIARIALDDVYPVTNDFYAVRGTGPNDVWVVGQNIALHKQAP